MVSVRVGFFFWKPMNLCTCTFYYCFKLTDGKYCTFNCCPMIVTTVQCLRKMKFLVLAASDCQFKDEADEFLDLAKIRWSFHWQRSHLRDGISWTPFLWRVTTCGIVITNENNCFPEYSPKFHWFCSDANSFNWLKKKHQFLSQSFAQLVLYVSVVAFFEKRMKSFLVCLAPLIVLIQ